MRPFSILVTASLAYGSIAAPVTVQLPGKVDLCLAQKLACGIRYQGYTAQCNPDGTYKCVVPPKSRKRQSLNDIVNVPSQVSTDVADTARGSALDSVIGPLLLIFEEELTQDGAAGDPSTRTAAKKRHASEDPPDALEKRLVASIPYVGERLAEEVTPVTDRLPFQLGQVAVSQVYDGDLADTDVGIDVDVAVE